MYAGNVMVRFCLSPLIVSRCNKNTFPFVSTTCQCGAGASGILKSSDQVKVSLLPDRLCVAVPLFAFTPSNFAVLCASAAKPFDVTNNPVTAIMLFPDDWLRQVDRNALAERLNAVFGRDLGEAPPIVSEQLKVMGRCNVTSRLAALAGIPTLVVSGRHDPIAPPAFGHAIAAGIPQARYVEIEDASHALTIQSEDRVNALLREHLDAVP